MKNKILGVLVATIATATLFGCGAEKDSKSVFDGIDKERNEESVEVSEKETIETEQTSAEETESIEESKTDNEISVKEYQYVNDEGSIYYAIAVTNNTEINIKISGSGTPVDQEGNEMGESDRISFTSIGPNETALDYMTFKDVDEYEKIDYELNYEPTEEQSVISQLTYEAKTAEDGLEIFVTNQSDYVAKYVNTVVIYYDNKDEVIGMEKELVCNSDTVIGIEPLFTESNIFSCPETYDHYEVYYNVREVSDARLSGYNDKVTLNNQYLHRADKNSTTDIAFLQNNTEETVYLRGNAVVKDVDGNIIACASNDNECFCPNQETYLLFFFDIPVSDIGSIEYHYSAEAVDDMKESQFTIDLTNTERNNYTLTVVNEGEDEVKYIRYAIVFMDAEGDVINYKTGYVYNEDKESVLAPGETGTATVIQYDEFDSYAIAFGISKN